MTGQPRDVIGQFGPVAHLEVIINLVPERSDIPGAEHDANELLDASFYEARDLARRIADKTRHAAFAAETALAFAEQPGGDETSNWWATTQAYAEEDLSDLGGLAEATVVGLARLQGAVDEQMRLAADSQRSGSVQVLMCAEGQRARAASMQRVLDDAADSAGLLPVGGASEMFPTLAQRWSDVNMVAAPVAGVDGETERVVVSFVDAGDADVPELARLTFDAHWCRNWDGDGLDKTAIVGAVTAMAATDRPGSAAARDLIAHVTQPAEALAA